MTKQHAFENEEARNALVDFFTVLREATLHSPKPQGWEERTRIAMFALAKWEVSSAEGVLRAFDALREERDEARAERDALLRYGDEGPLSS